MEATFKFKKGQKVKIVTRLAILKKYAKETGEIIDYGYARVETIPKIAKVLPKDKQLRIYQVRRDKNGFLITLPENALAALNK